MKNRHIQRHDKEGWAVESKVPFQMSCCDCGLTHTFVLVAGKKGSAIGIAAKRDARVTAQLRRHRKYKKP